MNLRPLLFAAMSLLCLATPVQAEAMPDLLWFSDVPPKRAKTAPMPAEAHSERQGKRSDSMDAVIGGEESGLHGGVKRLWLRQGNDPGKAGYVPGESGAGAIQVIDAHGKRSSITQTPQAGLAHARCQLDELGFYNAYLSRRSVRDGVLRVQLAKAEMLKGTCCMKVGELDPVQQQAIRDPAQPLEIVREHEADEKLFTRIVSGDKVKVTVYRLGQPLPRARVTMLTQQGWQKKVVTDAAGRAEFTVIRDYFPDWKDFKRRTKETFVLVAETETDEGGALAGQAYARTHYQATLSGKYQLSPYDYKSYAWGLGVTLFVVVFGGVAVYLFRRRRVKPFREVRFDEAAA